MAQRWTRLVELRSETGLTQEEFAKRLEITRSALSNYESGHREPDLETINKLATFFGTSVDYLVGRSAQRSPDSSSTMVAPEWHRVIKIAQERGYSPEEVEATLQVIDRMVQHRTTKR